MEQDEIIWQNEVLEMAELAGFEMDDSGVLSPQVVWYIYQESLIKFAKLVAKAASDKAVKSERKECVALCKDIEAKSSINTFPKALECAEAIRARGTEA